MIVVVEGPSGAGKTTWCRRFGGAHALLEEPPDHAAVPETLAARARFWVERNVARWQLIVERERRDGLVVVDTDPFKLYYVWTLWRTGQASEREWVLQRDAAGAAFGARQYGLADLFLVADLDEGTLRSRRDGDASRMRRNFDRHVRLRDSLLWWYSAIDQIEPGRVVLGLPATGMTPELLALGPRRERSGTALFVRLLATLLPRSA